MISVSTNLKNTFAISAQVNTCQTEISPKEFKNITSSDLHDS